MKLTTAKRSLATLAVGSAMVVAGAGPAAAQTQDGLVNVFIGDDVVNVEDVNVGVAASLAATLCDVADVGNVVVAVLARAEVVDRTGREQTICRTDAGAVTIRQN